MGLSDFGSGPTPDRSRYRTSEFSAQFHLYDNRVYQELTIEPMQPPPFRFNSTVSWKDRHLLENQKEPSPFVCHSLVDSWADAATLFG
jgi:hypothetical protein